MKIRLSQWMRTTALCLAISPAAVGACKIAQVGQLPVNNAHNRPVLSGQINGQPVAIMVDTGAQFTFIWAGAARRLGMQLQGVQALRIFGVGGEGKALGTVVKNLQIGSFTDTNLRVLVIEGKEGEKPGQPAMVLGEDFFANFATEFDLAHGVIRLLQPRGCKPDQLAYWSQTYSLAELRPVTAESPRLTTEVVVNGKRIEALLDTGAQTSVITRSAAEGAGVAWQTDGTAAPRTVQGIAHNPLPSQVGTFDSFSIGDETVRHIKLRIAELFRGNAAVSTGSRIAQPIDQLPSMIVGCDFFRSHHLLILPNEHKLLFTYNGGPLFQYLEPEAEPDAVPAEGETPAPGQRDLPRQDAHP